MCNFYFYKMFSLFGDNEMNFDVVSSPISYNEIKQQDTDFTMGFNPNSPSKVVDITSVDQDFFSDFSSFESTLTMSPGLGVTPSLNFNFQEQPQIQPIQANTSKGIVMPDVCINRLPTMNRCTGFIPNMNVYQKPSVYPIPSTSSKENLNYNIQYPAQTPKQQTHKDSISLPKKQKLKRKCEVFQPFTSFANLEMTVKSLRNIVKNNTSTNNNACAPTSTRIYAPPPQPMIASLA